MFLALLSLAVSWATTPLTVTYLPKPLDACPICLEEFQLVPLGCGHGVCASCTPLLRGMAAVTRCPLCRAVSPLPEGTLAESESGVTPPQTPLSPRPVSPIPNLSLDEFLLTLEDRFD